MKTTFKHLLFLTALALSLFSCTDDSSDNSVSISGTDSVLL